MQQNIVIDTNIWIKAIVDSEYDLACDDALSAFFQCNSLYLALDYNNEIEREYRDNIKNSRKFELRMKQLSREQRKVWGDSKLSPKDKNTLQKLGFHEEEDHVFVGTAVHADKVIITEDSDYGVHGESDKQPDYEYMKNDMELSVLTAAGFLDKMSS